jgi:hypothetical protein
MTVALLECMTNPRTDQPAPHAGEKEKGAGVDDAPVSLPTPKAPATAPKDADSPHSRPQGTLEDQEQTMESEGQAQPQDGDLPQDGVDVDGVPKST